MIMPEMQNLYKPYSKDADLNTTMEWLRKQAASLKIPDDIRDAAIAETFLEMAQGKKFNTERCTCGCEFPIPWSSVDMNHYTLKKMQKLQAEVVAERQKIIGDRLNAAILSHIEQQNAEFIKENMVPTRKERFRAWWRGVDLNK